MRGFLKPLPLSSQIWQEIFIDFIIDFPENDDCTAIIVVINQLNKDMIIKPLKDTIVEIMI